MKTQEVINLLRAKYPCKEHPEDKNAVVIYRIIQNGKAVLSSNQSLQMIWNNLTGKNIKGKEYKEYISMTMSKGFKKGLIELEEHGEIKDKFELV